MELSKIAQDSATGGFYLVAGTAISTIIGAIVVIMIARLLGPGGYGLYTLCFVIPNLATAMADLGISPALTRYGASLRSDGKHDKLASMIASGILFDLIAGSVATILVFAFSTQLAALALKRQGIGQLVALASITILPQSLFTLSYNAFVGLDKMELGALIMVARDVTRTIMSPLLIVVGFGVAGAIAGQSIGWVFAGLLGVWFLLNQRRILKQVPSKSTSMGIRPDLEMMTRFGLPIYAGNLLVVILTQYQNLVLAFFASNIEIGNFSAAVNFGALVGVLATPITNALFPAFAKLDLQTAKDDLEKMLDRSICYTLLLILPVAVAVAALSKYLTRTVYGSSYTSAGTYLVFYMCAFLLTVIGYQVLGSFFNGIGKTKETLKIALVQLAIFIVVAPLMTWLYQVPGLIGALVVSALVRMGYGLMLASGKYRMRVDLKGYVLVLAASLCSALPILPLIYYSHFSSLVSALIGAAIYITSYLTLLPVCKAIKRTDLETLTIILSRIRIIKPVIAMLYAYESWLLARLQRD